MLIDSQYENTLSPIDESDGGNWISLRDLQLEKTSFPIYLIDVEKLTTLKELQLLNARSFIDVTYGIAI